MFPRNPRRVAPDRFFFYKGVDQRGQKVKGEVMAQDARTALQELRGQGYLVLKLKKASSFTKKIRSKRGTEEKRLMLFSYQMALLLEGGLPLMGSLELLGRQTPEKKFKVALERIKEQLMHGNSLFAAISEHPGYFPPFFLQMIRIGEETGQSPEILKNLARYYRRRQELKREITQALRYPIFVLAVAAAVIFFLLFSVVPYFAAMYGDFGQELPSFTRLILIKSETLKKIAPQTALLLIISWGGGKQLIRRETAKKRLDRVKAGISPLAKIIWARIASSLSLLFKAGVPLDRSVELIGEQIENKYFQEGLGRVRNRIEGGEQLSRALQSELNPEPFLISMIELGEETGKTEEMAQQAALHLEDEIEAWFKRITALLEPVMIIFVAGVVGLIMLGLVLPMLEMLQVW